MNKIIYLIAYISTLINVARAKMTKGVLSKISFVKKVAILILLFSPNINGNIELKKFNLGLISDHELFLGMNNKFLSKWFKEYAKKRNIHLHINFYDEPKDSYKDYIKNRLDFTFIRVEDFFKYENKIKNITKKFSFIAFEKKDNINYCLLVNKSIKFNSVKDIKNKTISLLKGEDLSYIWINKMSLETNHKSAKKLLDKINYKQKESTIVLNIYFKKADLGIVKKSTWQIMKSLNPSITKKVKVKYCTKKILVPYIAVTNKKIDTKVEKILYNILNKQDKSDDVEKFFNVIPFNHLGDLSNEQLNHLRRFFKQYRKVKEKYE